MAVTLVATPGAADANSYLTLEEALAYFETRSLVPAWEDADGKEALLMMATRLIDAMYTQQQRVLVKDEPTPYYRQMPYWTGAATDPAIQALTWPRTGMFNRNAYPIAVDAIPKELKSATAEMAAQLAIADRTLDSDVSVQGITSVTAGSVAVTFDAAGVQTTKILPDVVTYLLVPSWITEETLEWARSIDFEVL